MGNKLKKSFKKVKPISLPSRDTSFETLHSSSTGRKSSTQSSTFQCSTSDLTLECLRSRRTRSKCRMDFRLSDRTKSAVPYHSHQSLSSHHEVDPSAESDSTVESKLQKKQVANEETGRRRRSSSPAELQRVIQISRAKDRESKLYMCLYISCRSTFLLKLRVDRCES